MPYGRCGGFAFAAMEPDKNGIVDIFFAQKRKKIIKKTYLCTINPDS